MYQLRFVPRARARLALLLCAGVCGSVAACDRGSDSTARDGAPPAADVIAEARTFMDGYARDLLAGDRKAIAARYDRTGSYLLGNGRKRFMSHDSVVAQYSGANWSQPASFEWRDLSFEPLGPDAVVVAGQFAWGPAGGVPPMTLSYTALLRRQDGTLRIRLEDESIDPTSLPPRPPSDSTRK